MPTLGITADAYNAPNLGAADPFTLAAWHAAYWASDPGWSHPADGAAVTSWRDGSPNGRTLTMLYANDAYYRSAASNLNNRPAVEFVASAAGGAYSTTFSSVASPFSLFAVTRSATTTGQHYWAAAAYGCGAFIQDAQWGTYPGGQGGTANTSRHALYALFNGGSSLTAVDGVTAWSGDTGSLSAAEWIINAWANRYSAPGQNTYGFAGFKAGALTAKEHTDLLGWSRAYYATP